MKRKILIRVILAALAIFGFAKLIQAQERFSCDGATVVVQQGDDVWGLIERHCTGNKESARNHFVEILNGSDIFPGQTIIMTDK